MPTIPPHAPRESGSALEFRKDILLQFNPRFTPKYAARDDFFTVMGWAYIPLETAPSVFSQATILMDLDKNVPFQSCVIGIVPTHSLWMEPHGDCRNPSNIAGASFRFSLKPPCPQTMPTFHNDFINALEKLRLLQDSLPMVSKGTVPHPLLRVDQDTMSFCHPLFVRIGDVSSFFYAPAAR